MSKPHVNRLKWRMVLHSQQHAVQTYHDVKQINIDSVSDIICVCV